MSLRRLTYCGNVHPAESLDAWLDGVRRHAVPVARAQPGAFGLGAWWSAAVAAELTGAAARERVAQLLAETGLALWTLNVFPYGGFHDARVKEAVYRPGWSRPERVRYTLDAAAAAAALAVPGEPVPLSTLPVGYGDEDVDQAVENLLGVARSLAELETRTGVCCVLALEPEPFCVLETTAEAVACFDRLRSAAGAGDEAVVARHLGVCVDLCHLLVVGEDPAVALAELDRQGIAVPKIQVSSCLELRTPAVALDALLAFDEPRYLHQTVADNGARALDLDGVRARRAEFEAAGRVRTHFHVPVFWDREGPLGSTRGAVEAVLAGLPEPGPLLEVETYTWSVLDETEFGAADLQRGLCAELDFVRSAFG